MRLTHRWLVAGFLFLTKIAIACAAIAAQPGWEEVVKAAETEGEVTVYAIKARFTDHRSTTTRRS
jgi:hypothetical protein